MTVNCGTFHGGIAATTPTGSCRTITSAPSAPGRVDSHGNSRAIVRNASICIHGAGDCARLLNEIGEPISVVITSAISPSLAAYRPDRFCTTSIRSAGVSRGHGPSSNAFRAAATAASMSAALPSGTRATTSSECGETTSSTASVAGLAQAPPMNSASRSRVMRSVRLPSLSGGEVEPVGEAAGVVPPERAVLEEAPALGAVGAGTVGDRVPDVVDHAEHHPAGDGGVVEVVGEPLGEPGALPDAVRPVGVAAVAATDVDRHRRASRSPRAPGPRPPGSGR